MGRKYKTKFPMARIKKIMQLDNEIGKVALATPILISKALEVFMQNLVDEACKRVQNGGSVKLEPGFLKQCIYETEEFDFLKDLVINIENNSSSIAVSSTEENKNDSIKDADTAELTEIQDEDNTKSQLHKCPISTLLNNEPVTPTINRSISIDLQETDILISNNFNESSE